MVDRGCEWLERNVKEFLVDMIYASTDSDVKCAVTISRPYT